MKIIDLSHVLSNSMPVYPGTEPPEFNVGCSIDADGFFEKRIILYSHTGTHMDAPAHLIKDSKTLDQFPIEHYYGKAVLLDVSCVKNRHIRLDDILPHKEKLRVNEFAILHTGWSRYWGDHKYFEGYPVLTPKAADWLTQFDLKGLGLDAISVDKVNADDLLIHKTLLRKNIVIIENLTNLTSIDQDNSFHFSCLPLKFDLADGSPVRAVAIIETQ